MAPEASVAVLEKTAPEARIVPDESVDVEAWVANVAVVAVVAVVAESANPAPTFCHTPPVQTFR
jgi:hypothetical protein